MSASSDPTPKFERSLGLWHLVLFGLAFTAPMVVLMTFGILDQASRGTAAGSYLIAAIAISLTALSYGRMSAMHVGAGSAYSYTRRAIAPPVGFLVGWSVLLDYFLAPMVVALITGIYLSHSIPQVPQSVFIVVFLALVTTLNIVGIRVAKTANGVLMLIQGIVIVAFLALAVRYIVVLQGGATLETVKPFFAPGVPLSVTAQGASLAALSFLGFDAITTFSAEARRPQVDVPRAVLLVALISGALFVVAAFMAQLIDPYPIAQNASSAGLAIARKIGGDVFATIFIAGLVVSQFAAGLAAQASVGRLLYAMGNDGVLPNSIFGYIAERTKTPVFNLLASGVFGLLALFFSEEGAASLVNFGAFVAFTFVNLSVVATWFGERGQKENRNPLLWVLLPIVGAAFTTWLLFSLDDRAKTVGFVWIAIGFAYLLWLTRGFRRPTPELGEE